MPESFIGFYLLMLETERARDRAIEVATGLAVALREVHQNPQRMVAWNHAYDALVAYDTMMNAPTPPENNE